MCRVAYFLSTLQDKVSMRPNCKRTWCPDDAKTIGDQTCREQKPCFTSLILRTLNRCHRVVSHHEVMKLLSVQHFSLKASCAVTVHHQVA